MWLPKYTSFSLVKVNHRLRQFLRFEPHFIRYPETMVFAGSTAVVTHGLVGDEEMSRLWGEIVIVLAVGSSESEDVTFWI